MKRPALLVGCFALCLLLPAAGVRAQAVVPGVPTIGTVSSGDTSLTIPWNAPSSDGGSPITSYDLRYILSDAESKEDDDYTLKEGIWSSGPLSHVLTGLTKDTSYDLQVRAENANGTGDWSGRVHPGHQRPRSLEEHGHGDQPGRIRRGPYRPRR